MLGGGGDGGRGAPGVGNACFPPLEDRFYTTMPVRGIIGTVASSGAAHLATHLFVPISPTSPPLARILYPQFFLDELYRLANFLGGGRAMHLRRRCGAQVVREKQLVVQELRGQAAAAGGRASPGGGA